jgi:hypothetical protein
LRAKPSPKHEKKAYDLTPAGPLPLAGIHVCYPEIAPQVETAGSICGLKRSPCKYDAERTKRNGNKAFKAKQKKNDAEEGGNDKGNSEEEEGVGSRVPAT